MFQMLLYVAVIAGIASACLAQTCTTSASSSLTTVDASRFATTDEVKWLTDKVCKSELRLPGQEKHLKVVNFIENQLEGIPNVTIKKSYFDVAAWNPEGETMYNAARFKIGNKRVDVAGAIAYSLPTNRTYVSGQLVYYPLSVNLSRVDIRGKIVVRDFSVAPIPVAIIRSAIYYASPDAPSNGTYERPFLTTQSNDLLACSLGGAAGYISAFNVSREQVESYYSPHVGVNWLVPAIYTGAEQYQEIIQAASQNQTASLRIDAKTGSLPVPRLHATLPGMSNETIVIATHTDGATYVQENGPVALLTIARYFASLPMSARNKTIQFAFEASHLAYQRDSDKLLAIALNSTYDNANDTTAFVIALEHLGTREILSYPATDGSYGNVLKYSNKSESILWSVGPVQNAIDDVVQVAKARNLDNTIVSRGFPPANAAVVPQYTSFGGLGTYYNSALLPTMALISGPWSLWAPSFGAGAIDYERLRIQHIAIADVVLGLMKYSKQQLAGNYTRYRQQRAMGFPTSDILSTFSQYIDGPGTRVD